MKWSDMQTLIPCPEAEAKLANEINMKHSEGVYGKEMFSMRDKMVSVSLFLHLLVLPQVKQDDFEKFVQFLVFCRKHILLGETPADGARYELEYSEVSLSNSFIMGVMGVKHVHPRCGVTKVEGGGETSLLPHTSLAGSKWVPLAYFEGDTGGLSKGAKQVCQSVPQPVSPL